MVSNRPWAPHRRGDRRDSGRGARRRRRRSPRAGPYWRSERARARGADRHRPAAHPAARLTFGDQISIALFVVGAADVTGVRWWRRADSELASAHLRRRKSWAAGVPPSGAQFPVAPAARPICLPTYVPWRCSPSALPIVRFRRGDRTCRPTGEGCKGLSRAKRPFRTVSRRQVRVRSQAMSWDCSLLWDTRTSQIRSSRFSRA